MKLLLDQNLSHRLLDSLAPIFPGSTHVRLIGMAQAEDAAVWNYAKEHGLVIVTKDSDFFEYSLLHGSSPKVIWLKCGNTSTSHIREVLARSRSSIETFLKDPEAYCLELY